MTSSGSFRTRRLGNFNRSYKSLIKGHYRKNRQAKEDFEKLIARYIGLLGKDPRPPHPFGSTEPWPKGTYREGWELWKLDFDMPGLGGAAKHGRLIYMIDREWQTVYLLWLYTHAEFEGRPPEKSLKQLAKEAAEEGRRRAAES